MSKAHKPAPKNKGKPAAKPAPKNKPKGAGAGMAAAFGQNKANVKPHKPATPNLDASAKAYASGNDVAFKGAPGLNTAAHEAAHVVQQSQGRVKPTS